MYYYYRLNLILEIINSNHFVLLYLAALVFKYYSKVWGQKGFYLIYYFFCKENEYFYSAWTQ